MKNTAFTKFHEELGAKMVPFAGYNMPVEYFGINDEHRTVREKVGVFDVSHMGEFWVKGPKALEYLQKITTNDVAALTDGKFTSGLFTSTPRAAPAAVSKPAKTKILLSSIFIITILALYS